MSESVVTARDWYNQSGCTENTQKRLRILNEIRKIKYLSSNLGFIVNDNDFYLSNYRTDNLVYIEAKCFLANTPQWQEEHLNKINSYTTDPHFKGVFLFQHEKLGTTDGYTLISQMRSGVPLHDTTSSMWLPVTLAKVNTIDSTGVFSFIKYIMETTGSIRKY